MKDPKPKSFWEKLLEDFEKVIEKFETEKDFWKKAIENFRGKAEEALDELTKAWEEGTQDITELIEKIDEDVLIVFLESVTDALEDGG